MNYTFSIFDISVVGLIGTISGIIGSWLFNYFKNFASYHFLNKKDSTDLKLSLINHSYQEAEVLYLLLKETKLAVTQEDMLDKFQKFMHHLQHLCVTILCDMVDNNVFKYKYAYLIKDLIESKYIEDMYKVLDIYFEEEECAWLYDTYKKAKKNKFIE